MIGIRVDANSTIATGHIMRCITIADQIVKRGESVTFFMSDEDSRRIMHESIEEYGKFDSVILHTDWNDPEGELPVLIEQLQLRKIDTLVIDSYFATYDYIKAIDRVCRTVYIDDLNEKILPVDMLINYNVYAGRFDYKSSYSGIHGKDDKDVRFLLGPMYAPLREQFATAPARKGEEGNATNILLAVGGADTCGILMPMLRAISDRSLPDSVMWHVVIGGYVDNAEEIEAYAAMHKNMTVHRKVKNMAALMAECDLAVCAAGTMLTECAALSLPAVFFRLADNQRYVAEYWSNNEAMIYAGDVKDERSGGKDAVIAEVLKAVSGIVASPDRLRAMRAEMTGITDGRGAERLAKEIMGMNGEMYEKD